MKLGFRLAAPVPLLFLPFALAQCGGDAVVINAAGDSGSDSSLGDTGPGPGPGSDGGTMDSTVTGNDAATGQDTGTGTIDAVATVDTGPTTGDASTCDPPDGGFPCDPGSVYCGGAPCSTPANYCCMNPNSMNGSMCLAAAAPCQGQAFHCDEITDCPMNDICCLVAQSAANIDSECRTSCSGAGIYSIQLCRSNTECTNGSKCIVQKCQQSATNVEACGLIPGCTAL